MKRDNLLTIITRIAEVMAEQKQYLTELDNAIGDSDHGINMDRGFAAVMTRMPDYAAMEVDEILKDVGKQLMKVVGGSSGPLYGSAFKKAGAAISGKSEISMDDFLVMMDAAIAQIMKLGKSVEGEKTMLDAICPAQAAMKKVYAERSDYKKALASGAEAARAGVEFTRTIVATKGRASYLGERSLGHQDPGATSFMFMMEVIAELA